MGFAILALLAHVADSQQKIEAIAKLSLRAKRSNLRLEIKLETDLAQSFYSSQ